MGRVHYYIAVAFSLFSSAIQAQEGQVVEITGSRIAQVPVFFQFVTAAPFAGTIPNMSEIQLVQMAQMARAAQARRDTRCMLTNDLRRTTSRSDPLDRWMAASAVYAFVESAAPAIKGVIIGTARNPIDGITYKAFEIIYADNGKEKWLIFPEPRSSVKLFDDPLPGSLQLEDGIPKPSPSCGLG